jgi:5-formyltetrahydrofolate cyclo-ligase
MASPDPTAEKARLRDEALAHRDGLDAEFRAHASRAAATLLLGLPEMTGAALVSGFWPIRSEIDPRPVLQALHARGRGVALPVVAHPHLLFRLWQPGEALERRGFGLSEPPDDAPIVEPDLLLVPLAAFDRSGHRIGYGKGHYDRTLARLAARKAIVAVGVAFAVQECETIPAQAHDVPLDILVTEREIIRPASPR